ncbi:unnamed protein product [marine sediment metagenome]|uniref:Uncharacterized protein n=1 Tax=marine sediment metagenome TaxID=412755 RepID=X1U1S1_9ZZZZ
MGRGLWTIIKMIYKIILRPLVLKAIDDPESDIDDFVMEVLDRIFEYETGD